MILTDKCKKMFEEYLVRLINPYIRYSVNYTVKQDGSKVQEHTALLGQDLTENQICEWFYSQPLSMQQGVYLEFLREQGYEVAINPQFELGNVVSCEYYYRLYNLKKQHKEESGLFPDYNTALTQAITKCNELINEQQNNEVSNG